MGVNGLSYLLFDASPHAVRNESHLRVYEGKIIAFDASQYLYQSLAPKRTKKQMESGVESRSPLILTFNACMRLLENGIKPLFVFDGHAPALKQPVIKERRERRKEAVEKFEEAASKGETFQMEILRPQTVRVSKTVSRNCKDLLKLLGIPYFTAPGEAEAQCAAFAESGLVYGTATMDMDALSFGNKVVLRNIELLNQATKRKPINEVHLDKFLGNLCLTMEEFVELSILMGCDYCGGVKGLGAHRAIELIHRYKTIENILDNTDMGKFTVPDNWLYKEARNLFLNPTVKKYADMDPFIWREPNVEGTLDYLSLEKGFEMKQCRKRLQDVIKSYRT